MDTSSASVTVNVTVPVSPVDVSVAVIVMGPPGVTPVASPLKPAALLMVAIPVFEEVQVTDDVRSIVVLSE